MYVRLGCRLTSRKKSDRSSEIPGASKLTANSHLKIRPRWPQKRKPEMVSPLFLAPFCFNVKFQGMVILTAVFLWYRVGCYSPRPKISTSSTNRFPKLTSWPLKKWWQRQHGDPFPLGFSGNLLDLLKETVVGKKMPNIFPKSWRTMVMNPIKSNP